MAKTVFFFGDGRAEGDPKRRNLLGGKGAGLAEMTALGLPVPFGFTISTEACHAFARSGAVPAETCAAKWTRRVDRLEKSMGARLGDTKAPLLVSVRAPGREPRCQGCWTPSSTWA